jgi:hypothetical protein
MAFLHKCAGYVLGVGTCQVCERHVPVAHLLVHGDVSVPGAAVRDA